MGLIVNYNLAVDCWLKMIVPGAGFGRVKCKRVGSAGIEASQRIEVGTNLVGRVHARRRPVRSAVVIDEFNRIADFDINNVRGRRSVGEGNGYGLTFGDRAYGGGSCRG